MSFNVRVYGVLMDKIRGILVSNELIKGEYYIKFPGGGLEYGEGTRDCLKREFREELDLPIEVTEHLYTTDFFQESAFRKNDQLISIYYFVRPLEEIKINRINKETAEVLASPNPHADLETFRFIPFDHFNKELLSFPVDKVVAQKLNEDYLNPDKYKIT